MLIQVDRSTKICCNYFIMIGVTLLCCRSPGYGISLVAETTSGSFISVDTAICYGRGEEDDIDVGDERKNLIPPEDVGEQIASQLLGEIEQGGVVDSSHQVCLFTSTAYSILY